MKCGNGPGTQKSDELISRTGRFKVVAEVKDWQGHSPEEIKATREKIDLALKNGAPIIED